MIQRVALDLVLTIRDTDDRITLQGYFNESYQVPEDNPYQIEKIEFGNGTAWTVTTIKELSSPVRISPRRLSAIAVTTLLLAETVTISLRDGAAMTCCSADRNDFIRGGRGDILTAVTVTTILTAAPMIPECLMVPR